MPEELAYALRVNVADLRPWEYDNMDADQYESIVYHQNIYHRELSYARQDRANMEKARADAEAAHKANR